MQQWYPAWNHFHNISVCKISNIFDGEIKQVTCFVFFRERKPFQSAQFRLLRPSAKVCGTFPEPSRSSPTTRSTSSRSRTGVMPSSGCSVCRSLWRARRKGMKIFRLSIHAFPPCQTQDPALDHSLWPARRQNYSVYILLNDSHTFWPIIFLWNL